MGNQLVCNLNKFNADDPINASAALSVFATIIELRKNKWLTEEEFQAIKRAYFMFEEVHDGK